MSLAIWLEATRPRTLPAAAAPVLVGIAIAIADGTFHLVAGLGALAGAFLIQIGTNYANDYFDFKKGADTEARVGPRRATAAGLVAPSTMKRAFILTFGLAFLVGLGLVYRAGWPILVVGVASIVSGVLYTGGPRPLGYLGLGDVFVLVFFGPVAVAGTVFVQSLSLSVDAIVIGFIPGLLSTAILAVNNLRDADTDVLANKRTVAVRFGKGFARVEYAACVLVPFGIVLGLAARDENPWLVAVLLGLPLALGLIKQVRGTDGAALNPLLGRTGGLLVVVSVLFSIAWVLGASV